MDARKGGGAEVYVVSEDYVVCLFIRLGGIVKWGGKGEREGRGGV